MMASNAMATALLTSAPVKASCEGAATPAGLVSLSIAGTARVPGLAWLADGETAAALKPAFDPGPPVGLPPGAPGLAVTPPGDPEPPPPPGEAAAEHTCRVVVPAARPTVT